MPIDDPPASYRTLTLERHPAPSGPWLLEVGEPHRTASYLVEPGRRLVLGSGRRAEVRVTDRTVSATHALIQVTNRGVVIEDLDSKNGVYVAGARVSRAELRYSRGAVIVGRSTLTVSPVTNANATKTGSPIPGIVGDSLCMRTVASEIRRIAPLRGSVLIQGESGTGKDLVAKALHELSGRPGAYVPVNIGGMSESLADAELFGWQQGAFTGAVGSRPGAFEQANAGTLFLDEIGELSPTVQVKLLRAVEERAIRRLGATANTMLDTRIVSATWADLQERVSRGAFRADLFHRVSTLCLRLPPLRQRRSDIPLLCQTILESLAAEVGPKSITSAALSALSSYSWPGNVRELGSVLYRAAARAERGHIEPKHLELPKPARLRADRLSETGVRTLLQKHGGNVSAVARATGIPRTTLRARLRRMTDGRSSERSDE